MKIRVVNRNFVEQNQNILKKFNVISIFSSNSNCPVEVKVKNLLKLQFDDIIEETSVKISFNDHLASQVKDFFERIKDNNLSLLVHCDAGISRSGAVGYIANEYFNKYLENNFNDQEYFEKMNIHILPNPLVVRVLKNKLWSFENEK